MRALIKKWVLLMLMLAFVANINVLAVNAGYEIVRCEKDIVLQTEEVISCGIGGY